MVTRSTTYPAESAGALMTTHVPTLSPHQTVKDALTLLRKGADELETINYLYLVDAQNLLKGVVSLRELLAAKQTARLDTLSPDSLVTVRAHTDQERVAHLALRHNLKSIPVISRERVFLGVVPSDTILRILDTEYAEDILHLAGVTKGRATETSTESRKVIDQVRARLPWLILGLLGGLCAAVVIETFETILEHHIVLVAFIPAIVYMADAVGSQTQMLFIRSLAKNAALDLRKYFMHEWAITSLLGGIIALTIFFIAALWLDSSGISLVLALSIFLAFQFSILAAILLPWSFARIGFDPAIASGPFATVVRDISSLAIYLGVATLIL